MIKEFIPMLVKIPTLPLLGLLLLIGCYEPSATIQLEDSKSYFRKVGSTYLPLNLTNAEKPVFRGGNDAVFFKELFQTLRYPEAALQNQTGGPAVVYFGIDADGSLAGIDIFAEPGDGCGEAVRQALELILQGKAYEPGTIFNTLDIVYVELELYFRPY